MSKHDGHDVKLVYTNVTVEHSAVLNADGDVVVKDHAEILRIDGDSFVHCDTCDERVYAGEDGLSDEWQVL